MRSLTLAILLAAPLLAAEHKAGSGSDSETLHWSFQPVRRPDIPQVDTSGWARNPIDLFIAARLAQDGLKPSPQADRPTLIRRLKFDLLGLPPTPNEVDDFVKNERPDAYERLVDRYLASPQFGERWARHWLDVVRFAETTGFETNAPRLNAWPYRDYVIRAFNENKPYDQFIRDQLAGDANGDATATGYLVAGANDQVKGDPLLSAQQRADELHDIISTTGGAFLGLTIGCARCHDHKFDPISQTDYYAMKAMFAGVQHGERAIQGSNSAERETQARALAVELADIETRLLKLEPLATVANEKGSASPKRAPVNSRRNVERFAAIEARFVRMTILETTGNSEPCIDELEILSAGDKAVNVALAGHGTKAAASGTLPGFDIHKLEHINDGLYGNGRSWISNERGKGWVQLELPETTSIDTIIWGRDRNEVFTDRLATKYRFEVAVKPDEWRTVAGSDDRLPVGAAKTPAPPGLSADDLKLYQQLSDRQRELTTLRARLTSPAMVYAGQFANAEPTFLLARGEVNQKKDQIAPAAPAQFGKRLQLPMDAPEQKRRLALAEWIADAKNPLTARVLVNRLWHYHFGTGLVATPSDFGKNGARPSHPELLDWLAEDFKASGWDVKHTHRLILLSSTYRQASTGNPAGHAADAGARLLWRFPPRRLEAEPLRDTILFVSGNLDQRMGGPGFDLFEPNTNYVHVYTPKKTFGPAEWRRMIYFSKPRMRLDDTFGAFDCPDAGQTAPKRTTSTTALQTFNLLNSPFMQQQSQIFAQRLEREAADDVTAQVRRGYWLAYQRAPDDDEIADSVKLAREHRLKAFCLALFNSNEFMYVH